MRSLRLVLVVGALLFIAGVSRAQAPQLLSAHGAVEKAEKESLAVKPRSPEGKFQRTLALRITGTSQVTTLVPQMRAGKQVMTQRETDVKDLQPGQAIALIYTTTKEGPVLLTAIVLKADEK